MEINDINNEKRNNKSNAGQEIRFCILMSLILTPLGSKNSVCNDLELILFIANLINATKLSFYRVYKDILFVSKLEPIRILILETCQKYSKLIFFELQ